MKGDAKYLNMLEKAMEPRKGSSRMYFEARTEIIKAMKEDVNARRFFRDVQKLLSNLLWRAVREQSEKESHEKAQKLLDEAHRKIIDARIEAYNEDKLHIQGISGQRLHEFLGWTWEEYVAYNEKDVIPERTKMPYPDIDVVVIKKKGGKCE